ncbi:DNA repair protein RecO [Corallincola luteus]|uniref:DNA repair protein RecO n=1 Tax=Corallincola luteus TaxID=1775177 RepID=A0ABY2APS3_9GAMM|nr:DNA repair protein RecO [Corallincola luteus]TCI05012.1 DNA repair protein RecO [Corallincola luteus]
MTAESASAFLLHRRPYRETSLLVDLFHLDLGYVRAVCRGARSKSKGTAALMQPFTPLLVELSGRGELLSLRHAEADGPAYQFTGSALYTALYLNELLVRLLPQSEPVSELFSSYSDALAALAQMAAEMVPDQILRPFELLLLDTLGFGIDFQSDTEGHCLSEQLSYRWLPEQGWLAQVSHGDVAVTGVYPGAHLLAIARGAFDNEAVQRSAKLICRQALSSQLGSRPLKSRELFAHFLKGKRP